MILIKHISIFNKTILYVGTLFVLLGARIASAYALLESIPGVSAGSAPSLASYLRALFLTGIGLAGVLSVLMIVIGGIQYIGSGMSPSGQQDAKDRITNAILGLLLALGSYLLLNTINPALV